MKILIVFKSFVTIIEDVSSLVFQSKNVKVNVKYFIAAKQHYHKTLLQHQHINLDVINSL